MPTNYEDRVTRVLQYINADPGGDMSLDRLADVAAMSRFHWHRVFAAMTGETCAQAVRRIRLHRAACLMTGSDMQITEVARAVGYGSINAFTRAFSDAYGASPTRFRQRGDMVSPVQQPEKGDYPMFPVEIKDIPAVRLAGLHYKGNYMGIGEVFEKVSAMAFARNLWPQTMGMAGLYWDDPKSVPADELRSFAGLWMQDGADTPEGLEVETLPAGRVAVMHYTGPYAGMQAAYDYLFGVWLPQSGKDMRDLPCFEHYLSDPRNTDPNELRTDICLYLA